MSCKPWVDHLLGDWNAQVLMVWDTPVTRVRLIEKRALDGDQIWRDELRERMVRSDPYRESLCPFVLENFAASGAGDWKRIDLATQPSTGLGRQDVVDDRVTVQVERLRRCRQRHDPAHHRSTSSM